MFLSKIEVKNFRCLNEIKIDLDNSTIFIGENNSGKTALLDLIRNILGRVTQTAFFNEYDYYLDESIQNPQDSEGIFVLFIFEEQQEGEWHDDLTAKYINVIQPFHDDAKNIDLMRIYLRVSSKYNEATEQFEVSYSFTNNKNEDLPQKTQTLIGEFLKLNPVFYLQALRDSNEVFSGKSYMWGRFLKQVKFKPDDLQSLQNSIEALNSDIIGKDESLSQLVKSLNDIDKVLDFKNEGSVSVNALPMKSWDLMSKAQVSLKNKENLNLPLERYGQGTQSMAVILLYEAYINILLKKTYNKFSQAILTLEEPETHLHPQAVRAFEKQLRGIETQKIITTHSPYFVQNTSIYQIRLFKKNGGKTKILSIPKQVMITFDQVPDVIKTIVSKFSDSLDICNNTLLAKKAIETAPERSLKGYIEKNMPEKVDEMNLFVEKSHQLFSEEEVYQLNTFVQKSRGELFFAKGWLMAEGQTEAVILPYFARVLGFDLDERGISYIEYRSNGSAKAFTKLAKSLEFEWSLLADNDDQGASTLTEIRNNGYSESAITDRVRLTNKKDIEHELMDCGFLNDYEIILEAEIDDELKTLKTENIDEYKRRLSEISQAGKGKVKNAYKLVEALNSRNMNANEIPEIFKFIIERVCKNV